MGTYPREQQRKLLALIKPCELLENLNVKPKAISREASNRGTFNDYPGRE